jgi:hypothetical protein
MVIPPFNIPLIRHHPKTEEKLTEGKPCPSSL